MHTWSAVGATMAGLAGIVLTVGMALPQSVRIWREQTTLGVSLGTWTLFSLSFSLWIGYAVRVHNELNFVCNLGTLASAAILMTGFARYSEGAAGKRVVLLAVLVLACFGLSVVGRYGPLAVVGVLLLSGVSVRVPQLFRSASTHRTGSWSGVSKATWWASLGAGACWAVHGALRPDYFIMMVSTGTVILSAGVLAFEYAADRSRESPSIVQTGGTA